MRLDCASANYKASHNIYIYIVCVCKVAGDSVKCVDFNLIERRYMWSFFVLLFFLFGIEYLFVRPKYTLPC